jgi:hypothetical protein
MINNHFFKSSVTAAIRLFLGLTITCIFAFGSGLAQLQVENATDGKPKPATINSGREKPTSPVEDARSEHYGKGIPVPVHELDDDLQELPVIVHWAKSLDTIPVKQSDVILVGTIKDAQCHLSQNQQGVYTSYQVVPEKTIKPFDGSIPTSQDLDVERPGGTVRFPSGKVQHYSYLGQGVLTVGSKYVLFLKRNQVDGDYTLLTAFEMIGGNVRAVDGLNAGSSFSVFDKADGMKQAEFFARLEQAKQQ